MSRKVLNRLSHRRQRRVQSVAAKIVAASLALGFGFAQSVAQAQPNEGMAGSKAAVLTVGVDYVPPPFVGGSKVRTLERIDTYLAEALANQLKRQIKFVELDTPEISLAPGSVDIAIVDIGQDESRPGDGNAVAIATGQVTRPMAIMRTDTDIKSWKQLEGRTVCVSEDGRYVGRIAQQYGAIEQVYKAPADSLLALRVGECDAAVHDDTMLNALLSFPEWKKFSAKLTSSESRALHLVVPAGNKAFIETLEAAVSRWNEQGYFDKLILDMTRDIAFEVYLDQTVPDCH